MNSIFNKFFMQVLNNHFELDGDKYRAVSLENIYKGGTVYTIAKVDNKETNQYKWNRYKFTFNGNSVVTWIEAPTNTLESSEKEYLDSIICDASDTIYRYIELNKGDKNSRKDIFRLLKKYIKRDDNTTYSFLISQTTNEEDCHYTISCIKYYKNSQRKEAYNTSFSTTGALVNPTGFPIYFNYRDKENEEVLVPSNEKATELSDIIHKVMIEYYLYTKEGEILL